MDCRIICIRGRARKTAGITLVETVIAMLVGSLLATVVGALLIFGAQSFKATTNFLEMEQDNRLALDVISRDLRQARGLVNYTPQALVLQDFDNTELSFVYSPLSKTLVRVKGGSRTVLLRECNSLDFSIFQRTPIAGAYDFFAANSAETCKLIQLRWVCSRSIPGVRMNTESIQNAKVVIRKKPS